jgi:hypothetical protein
MRILMIHGRSQGGLDPNGLRATWIATLKEGFRAAGKAYPDGIAVDFPYYADTLDAFAAGANLPTPADVVAKGPGQNVQFEQFMQSALAEIQRNADISDAEVMAKMDPAVVQQKGIENWAIVQALARVIDDRLTGASLFTIENFLRDVYLYVTNREVARQIDAIVNATLTGEPTLVIGHSLGSVVGYNAIVNNRATMKLRKYVTVGCPLGLRAVSTKLGMLQNPAGKDGWYNAYDERDIVALNPLDNTYFPTNPTIVNYDKVRNQTDNRHGIVGYLNDAHVAEQVAAALA